VDPKFEFRNTSLQAKSFNNREKLEAHLEEITQMGKDLSMLKKMS